MATQASYKPQFYVDALEPVLADAAYPLVRSIAPEVTLEDWLDYVERRCREGGLKGLFDVNGALVGLFSYRFGERLRHGRVLALDDFVTFELSRAAPGRAALMAAAEELARSLGCTGIEVRIASRGFAEPDSPKASGWLALGLALDSVIFVKPLQLA
jgi:hypothetical protein